MEVSRLQELIKAIDQKIKLNKGDLSIVAEQIQDDEKVLAANTGTIEKNTGAIILTDSNLYFASKVLFTKAKLTIPIDSIANVVLESGLMFATLTISDKSGGRTEIKNLSKFEAPKLEKAISNAKKTKTDNVNNTSSNNNLIEELKKLKDLLDSGVITEDEFKKLKDTLIK